jgi:hypothetical protein
MPKYEFLRPVSSHSPKFGMRADGTPKGEGYFGPLARPDGGVSSELTIGVSFDDGVEAQLPLLVPTLTGGEVRSLLGGASPTEAVTTKAIEFYKGRQRAGLPAFARPGEEKIPRPMASHGVENLFREVRARVGNAR